MIQLLAFFDIYQLFWVVIILIIVYLIIRRIRIKETETFEDRDN